MKKEFAFYSTFLVVAFIAAYFAAQPKSEDNVSEIMITSVKAEEVGRISYEGPQQVININQSENEVFWVNVQEKAEPKKEKEEENTVITEEATVDQPVAMTQEVFRANETLNDFLGLFAPLSGKRDLGKIAAADLEKYGFGKETKNLVLYNKSGNELFKLQIGKKVYGGSQYYAFIPDRSLLTIVDSEINNVLSMAKTRLFQKNILSAYIDDFDIAEINYNNVVHRVQKVSKGKDKLASWENEENQKEKNGILFETWLNKIEKLRAEEYAREDKVEQLKSRPNLFTLNFKQTNAKEETVILKSIEPAETEKEYWLYSNFLKGYVKVSENRVATILADLSKLSQS